MKRNILFQPPQIRRFILPIKAIVLVVGLLFSVTFVNATVYYARTTGTWTPGTATATIFSITSCATALSSRNPTAADVISICDGVTLTVGGTGTISSIIIGNGSTLTVNNTFTLTVTTSITLPPVLTTSITGTLSGAGTITAASLTIGGAAPPVGNNVAATTYPMTLTSSITTLTLSGNLTLQSDQNGSGGHGGLQTYNAVLNQTTGTVTVNGSLTTVNAINTATYTMGNLSPTLILGGGTPFNLDTGTNTITLNGTGATVNYAYAGTQTVYATAYNNLTLSGSGTKTLTGVSTINGNLTFSGSANATAAAGLTVGGDVVLGSVTTFNGSTYTHSIAGNWTNNGGTFTAGTGTVTMNGSAKTIGGTTSTTFYNLTINNASGTLLGNSETVSNILTLTSGRLTLGAYNLTLSYPVTNAASATAAAVAGTFDANTMIVADGTGQLIKTIANAAVATAQNPILYTFPIGDASGTAEYSPATIKFTAGTFTGAGVYVGVRVTNAKHPNNASTTNYLNRYWSVSSSGISAFSASFIATYVTADIAGSQAYQCFAQYTGSKPWIKYATLSITNLIGTASWPDLTSISGDFTGITVLSPTVSISANPGFSVGQNDPLSLTANPIGDATFTYSWSTGGTTQIINPSTASTGATTYSVTVTDGNGFTGTAAEIVSVSQIKLTTTSLTGFGYSVGNGPSSEQSFNISASSLSSNLIVSAPSDFEVSLNSGFGFGSSVFITPSGGTVNSTPVYVRMKAGLTMGYTRQDITLSSSGSTSVNVNCIGTVLPSITASGGGAYCTTSTITLSSTSSGVTGQYWTGPNSFYSTLASPQVTTNAQAVNAGTYTVTGNAESGNNLVTNGDFESGNIGFGHSYGYVAPATNVLVPEGLYTVVANPQSVHNSFSSYGDHTTGTGLQMVVNGATIPGVNIWSQSVTVVPNTNYQYTYWEQTVVVTAPSMLQLYINGVAAGPIYTAPSALNTWQQFKYNWNSGTSTTAYLSLVNQNTAPNGNDFALDDIRFEQVYSNSSSTVVSIVTNPAASITISASPSNSVCFGTTVTFTAVGSGGPSPSYLWYKNGTSTGVTTTTYTNSSLANNDVITCVLTKDASLGCMTGSPATSNTITMTVWTLPAITTSGTMAAACFNSSAQTTTLAYSATTSSPTSYYVDWNLAANTAGLADQGPTAFSFVSGVGTLTGIVITANTPAGTYSGTMTITNANSCTATQAVTVTVNPTPTLTGASQAATVCAGSAATINLAGLLASSTSTVNYTINGVLQTAVTGVIANGSGAAGFTSAALTGANNGQILQITGITTTSSTPNCSVTFAQNLTMSVDPATFGGAVSSSQAICSGTSPANLSLNSNVGNVVKWQKASNAAFTSPIDIAVTSTTLLSFTIGNLTTDTYFRAVVQSGVCAIDYSASVLITVQPALSYGTASTSGSTAICYNTAPTGISTSGATGSGSFSYQWYSQAGAVTPTSGVNTGWTIFTGQTGTSLTAAAITANTTYACWVTPGGSPSCGSANWAGSSNTDKIQITVQPALSYGTASTSGSTTICYNTAPTGISTTGATGSASFSYQWYSQAGAVTPTSGSQTGWTAVSGQTATSLTAAAITANTTYACWVTPGGSPSCGSANWAGASNTDKIQITIDNELPVFTGCPSNMTVNVDAGLCTKQVDWTIPTVTDNCGIQTLDVTASAGETISTPVVGTNRATITTGITTITYTATDTNGNVKTCVFTITVTDNIAPIINCPAGSTVFCVANAPSYSNYVDFHTAGGLATDNCNLATGTFTQLADILVSSTLTRTYRISDVAGNSSTCTQVFTISQPTVTINSTGLDNTCIGGALNITSNSTGSHYQWELSINSGGSWTVVGTDSPSFSGTLAHQGDQYRMLVSETTDFSGVGCVATSNVLTFRENSPPVFTDLKPVGQTVCTIAGASTAAVYGIELTNAKVADNCTTFPNLVLTYTLSGVTTGSGTTLTEGTVFNLGTTHINYSATDEAGLTTTYGIDIIVNQSPTAITITHSPVSGGGTGILPNQCGTYNYSVEGGTPVGGFNYVWKVFAGSGTGGTQVLTGFTLVTLNAASVQINWTGDLAPGTYTIQATKTSVSNSCYTAATLELNLQNNFDLQVADPGHNCKGEVGPTSPVTITWTVNRICGTSSWGFTWYLFAGDISVLPVDYQTVNYANGSLSGITGSTQTFDTNVVNGDPYTQTVYTLFIVNASDMNSVNNHNKFLLTAIPNTSEISHP